MTSPTILYIPGVDGAPHAGEAVLSALAAALGPPLASAPPQPSQAHPPRYIQFSFPVTKHRGSRGGDDVPGSSVRDGEVGYSFTAPPPQLEESRAAAANQSVEAMADVVAEWMEAQSVGAAAVIGESYGGAVAQTLARRFPQRVSKLALIASFTSHPARATGMMIGPALRWLPKWTLRAPVMAVSRMTVARGLDPEQRRRFYRRTFAMPFDDIGRRIAALRKFDSRPWLHEITIPTMWVWGEEERLVSYQAESRWLRDARPSDRQIVIAGAGHVIPHVQREVLVAHLRGFLGS